MNDDQLWQRLKDRIKSKCDRGKGADEYIVLTTLNKVPNRIRLHDDHVMRRSEKSKKWQKITKEDVIGIAKPAMQNGVFSIADPELAKVHGRIGSIVCSMLALLDEFNYRPKRLLEYSRK
jgi:hypothetical protein